MKISSYNDQMIHHNKPPCYEEEFNIVVLSVPYHHNTLSHYYEKKYVVLISLAFSQLLQNVSLETSRSIYLLIILCSKNKNTTLSEIFYYNTDNNLDVSHVLKGF